MKQPLGEGPPGAGVPALRLPITLKMLRNLLVVFEAAAEDAPLIVEITDRGVWAVTPDGQRIFVGTAAPADV